MFSRDSNQDLSNSTTGAQSEQSSSRSSSFGGGWVRPSSDSHPQASGGGGWGRPQHAQYAVGGRWGRRPASSEASTQPPQEPQQHQEHQEPQLQEESAEQAPPEDLSYEYLMHSFKKKFEIPKDLPQNVLPLLDNLVIDYIDSKSIRYGQTVKVAVDRALLKIHEDLQSKLRRTIPEKDSHPRALTMQEEFAQELTKILSSLGHTSPEHVKQFVAEYMRKPLSELIFSMTIDKDNGRPMCLKPSESCTSRHLTHSIHSYLLSLDIPSILTNRFGFIDSMMPGSLFRKLPEYARKLIQFARNDDGRVVNGYVIVYPPHDLFRKLYIELKDALIQDRHQAYDLHFLSLTSKGSAKAGDICLVFPGEINIRTKIDQNKGPNIVTMRTPTSQYQLSGPRGIFVGGSEKLDWQHYRVPYSFFPKNMKQSMSEFGSHLINHFGAVPFYLESDQMHSSEKQHDELEEHSLPSYSHSTAGGGWGAAAPK